MEEKKLLFQAAIKKENDVRKFYFVEQCDDQYFFKYGISRTDRVVEGVDNNRLSIAVADKEWYKSFKYDLMDYIGAEFGYNEANGIRLFALFSGHVAQLELIFVAAHFQRLKFYFDKLLAQQFEDKNNHIIIDRYKIRGKDHFVFHNKAYHEKYCKGYHRSYEVAADEWKSMFDGVRFAFLNYVQMNENPTMMEFAYKIADYYDLMQEYIYRRLFGKIPEDAIAVEGWTVDDLLPYLEGGPSPLIQSMYLLAGLRVHEESSCYFIDKLIETRYPYLY